jgi:hypothetical protein
LFDLRQSTKGASDDDEFIRISDEENTFDPVLKTHFYNNRNKKCSIYTVGVNPFWPHQLALAGSSSHVALYDSRKINTPYAYLCPEKLGSSTAHVTGLKYDHCGEMLIASYNDENIYSFYVKDHSIPTRRSEGSSNSRRSNSEGSVGTADTGTQRSRSNTLRSRSNTLQSWGDVPSGSEGYYRSYSGHRNNNTVKQVAYLGARSEFVVSGSDCGHIFIWDVHSSHPIQMLHGDRAGAINCLAAHPHLPILATSGLEDDAKVWAPTGEYAPIADGTPKKKKVDSVIERNQERTPPPTFLYSNSIIDMLTSLLNQDPTALQNLSDDDDDDDDDAIDPPGASHHPTAGTAPATSSQQSTTSPSSNRASARTHTTRIPWSLMRLIPVILGRRRRSSVQEDTSENEYDVEEDDVNDDREEVEDTNVGGIDEDEEDEVDEEDQDEFEECHDTNEPARSDEMALQQALEEEAQYRACNGEEEEEEEDDDDDDDDDENDEEGGDVWVDCMDDDEEPRDCCQGELCDQVVGI